jgi:hypothetical protein
MGWYAARKRFVGCRAAGFLSTRRWQFFRPHPASGVFVSRVPCAAVGGPSWGRRPGKLKLQLINQRRRQWPELCSLRCTWYSLGVLLAEARSPDFGHRSRASLGKITQEAQTSSLSVAAGSRAQWSKRLPLAVSIRTNTGGINNHQPNKPRSQPSAVHSASPASLPLGGNNKERSGSPPLLPRPLADSACSTEHRLHLTTAATTCPSKPQHGRPDKLGMATNAFRV